MRSLLVGSTVIVALTIPFYGYLMSLVGAFTTVAASILLPCLCYLKISGTYRKLCFESVIIVLTAVMGLVILVIAWALCDFVSNSANKPVILDFEENRMGTLRFRLERRAKPVTPAVFDSLSETEEEPHGHVAVSPRKARQARP
ncbi:hypothetical protein ACS0TY_007635 [Phlomoides rotata]